MKIGKMLIAGTLVVSILFIARANAETRQVVVLEEITTTVG